ncbi:MAG: hypothetical protein MZW92_53515 [Comamonadaceae bacterium]|nr:hypothetical protein [Comamonadaceae bacterium]
MLPPAPRRRMSRRHSRSTVERARRLCRRGRERPAEGATPSSSSRTSAWSRRPSPGQLAGLRRPPRSGHARSRAATIQAIVDRPRPRPPVKTGDGRRGDARPSARPKPEYGPRRRAVRRAGHRVRPGQLGAAGRRARAGRLRLHGQASLPAPTHRAREGRLEVEDAGASNR